MVKFLLDFFFLRLLCGNSIINIFCVYAAPSGLPAEKKDHFCYKQLLSIFMTINNTEIVIVARDFNGHVGQASHGFGWYHGSNGYGIQNAEGTRILNFSAATNLAVTNTFYTKRTTLLVTYSSGESTT